MALILVIRLFQYNPDMTLHPGESVSIVEMCVCMVVGAMGWDGCVDCWEVCVCVVWMGWMDGWMDGWAWMSEQ
jgi:hypothetical protein